MSATESIVERYFAAWNETDENTRRTIAAEVWSPDGRYVDPLSDVTGPDAFSDMVAAVHQQVPGHTVTLSSPIEQHHDQVRFLWQIVGPDGSVAIDGIDVAVLAADGRLRSVTGFFGSRPQEAAEAGAAGSAS